MAKKTKKSKKEATSSSSHKFWKVIGKIILILFIISIALPLAYRWINPPFTPLMVIRKIQNGTPIEKEWRDLDEISHYMVDCAVAAEYNNFLAHRGFDWGAIQKAINDHKKGKSNRGASTISQQTAKNVFLWAGHSWVRKAGEVYTACYPAPLTRNPGRPTAYLNRRAGKISGLSRKIGHVKFDKESIEKARQRYEKRKTEWYEIDL